MAHTEALGDYQGLLSAGVNLVVAAAQLQFRAPATFDDRLTVLVSFDPPGTTSLRSTFTIVRDETVLAECVMTHVCVDTATYRKQPWPDGIRDRLNSVNGSH